MSALSDSQAKGFHGDASGAKTGKVLTGGGSREGGDHRAVAPRWDLRVGSGLRCSLEVALDMSLGKAWAPHSGSVFRSRTTGGRGAICRSRGLVFSRSYLHGTCTVASFT